MSTARAPVVDILMFHSISHAGGATSITPPAFAAQMQALQDAGLPVLSLDQVAEGLSGGTPLPAHSVALTFDDGFQDFADTAWPQIKRRGWPVTVFLPTDRMGGAENWKGQMSPPRPLMSWQEVIRLSREGVDFGGHTATHADMPTLSPAELTHEIRASFDAIKARTGRAPRHFAPPYGHSTAPVRQAIVQVFATSCGTGLGQTRPGADLQDLPRLEMFYFTNMTRWRRHLEGRGRGYLALRRILRQIRQRSLSIAR